MVSTIVERHGHRIKDFPDPPSDAPIGVDATISEGWRDLKVRNDTDQTFQIHITFDPQNITGQLLSDQDDGITYQITNNDMVYYRQNNQIFEEVDIIQNQISKKTGAYAASKKLYRNKCEIGYSLPEGTPIIEKK